MRAVTGEWEATWTVPADILVYTRAALASRLAGADRFADTLHRETTWVRRRADFPGLLT